MSLSIFKHSNITGMSVTVPSKEINIYDEAEYYANNIKKIDRMRKMVGFYKRRVISENTTATDLALYAAKKLIQELNIDKKSIDAILFIVQEPDYNAPSSAYFIHGQLGLSDSCIATDINQGCAGWIFGIFMASQMIECGTFKKILVLNGDVSSYNIDIADRNLAPIFGDGGAATLVEYSDKENPQYFNITTKSEGFESIIIPSSGAKFKLNFNNDNDIELIKKLKNYKIKTNAGNIVNFFSRYLDGLSVFDFTVNVVPQNIRELLQFANCSEENIPYLCLHQANKQIIQSIASALDFPMKKAPYKAFENYGNNTMCSIPTTISLLDKNVSKKNICCSGFGNGLVCASAILNLDNAQITDIKTYKRPDYYKTREEYIEYWTNKMKG